MPWNCVISVNILNNTQGRILLHTKYLIATLDPYAILILWGDVRLLKQCIIILYFNIYKGAALFNFELNFIIKSF